MLSANRIVIALLISLSMLTVSCSPLLEKSAHEQKGQMVEGLGGSGQRMVEGIGGTGQKVVDGIGGTGIIGTITGFGSIYVHNAHIRYDDESTISMNGQPASANDLRLGHVVSVLSDRAGDGYYARTVDVVREVVGPIAEINSDTATLKVLAQNIVVTLTTRLVDQATEQKLDGLESLRAGQFVAVSGLRRAGGRVIASRIERLAKAPSRVEIIGKLGENNLLSGQPVRIESWMVPDSPPERLLVAGPLVDGVLMAEQVGPDSVQQVLEQVQDILLEGYVFDADFEGSITVGGIELAVPEEVRTNLPEDFDGRVFINGALNEESGFQSDHLEIPQEAAPNPDGEVLPEAASESIPPVEEPSSDIPASMEEGFSDDRDAVQAPESVPPPPVEVIPETEHGNQDLPEESIPEEPASSEQLVPEKPALETPVPEEPSSGAE